MLSIKDVHHAHLTQRLSKHHKNEQGNLDFKTWFEWGTYPSLGQEHMYKKEVIGQRSYWLCNGVVCKVRGPFASGDKWGSRARRNRSCAYQTSETKRWWAGKWRISQHITISQLLVLVRPEQATAEGVIVTTMGTFLFPIFQKVTV